mmetsp:Transcript_83835/g.135905  ORF Transcript_83835/g.135905 Transcript_83835/m.135905 type:complete len:113 (-) Transcript_83835:54-392(-)
MYMRCGPLAGALRLQASSKGLDLFESQPSPSTQRWLGGSSPLRDISNMQGVSPKRRVLLDPVTADELEEADKMVADIMDVLKTHEYYYSTHELHYVAFSLRPYSNERFLPLF